MQEKENIIRELIKTRQEIESAKISFDYAESPEMIDYFIYKMYSAERKYDCLLKLAKQNKIKEKEYLAKTLKAV